MKILAVSARVPAPDRKGDQVVSFFRIMHLIQRRHEVELVCFGDSKKAEDLEAKNNLEGFGVKVRFVRWRPIEALWRLMLALFNPRMPFQCAIFQSVEFQETLRLVQGKMSPDAVYCVMIRIAPNIEGFNGKIFVDMVDSMGLNFSRRVEMDLGVKRFLLKIEQRRVSAFERYIACKTDRSFVVSEIDKKAIGSDKVDAIPLGIDLNRFAERGSVDSANPIIIFTGNMNYQPNIEAITWFVDGCWAGIRSAIPSARLMIVGSNPSKGLIAMGENDDAIAVTGRVPSMSELLNKAVIAIAPMQSGSGMQFKILEAMACSVPVVASSLGLGDILARPSQDILIADTAVEFTAKVLQLVESPELNRKIGGLGRLFVEKNHSWSALNDKFLFGCGINS